MSGVRIYIRNPPSGPLMELANFIGREGWEVTQNAEEGSVGISTLYMDDLDESIWTTLGYNVGGRQQIRLVDIDSSRIVHFGFTGRRAIRRRFDVYGSPVGRAWSIEIIDPNTILQRRILTHNAAKRPRESDVERIEALLDMPEWGIITQFLIGPSETTMSKADYRGQTVADYINDCAQASRKNWWVDIVDDGAGDIQTFWYGRDTRSAYQSTLSISNDLADLSVSALSAGTATLVYPPSDETEYTMDPSRVMSGVYGTWEKGAVYRRRASTEATFGLRWDIAMQWPNVHEKDRAIARAESMLDRLDEEDERIETTILVPFEQAHLVRAGMLIPLKLTHVPRLESYADCRILSRGLSPIANGARYRIPLTLEVVGESDAALTCSTALSGAITNDETDGTPTGSVTLSITPEEGSDYLLIGGACGTVGSGMNVTGSFTELYAADYPISDHPTFAAADQIVTTASGSYTLTASYGSGEGTWAAVLAAIRTSSASPVQEGDATNTINTTTNFGSDTTVGNMLVMVRCSRDDPSVDPTGVQPTDIGWTKIAEATARFGLSQDVIAIFVACPARVVETSEDVGIPGGGHAYIAEWEIT